MDRPLKIIIEVWKPADIRPRQAEPPAVRSKRGRRTKQVRSNYIVEQADLKHKQVSAGLAETTARDAERKAELGASEIQESAEFGKIYELAGQFEK